MASELQTEGLAAREGAPAARWYATEGLAIAFLGAAVIAMVFLALGAPVWLATGFGVASVVPLARERRDA